MAKACSRETASIAHLLTKERSILTPEGSDHLAEIDAQADAALVRLREAAQAARDRLDAGLFAVRDEPAEPAVTIEPAEPSEPGEAGSGNQPPLVQMDDLNPATDDLF